jgi:hypothetical protein
MNVSALSELSDDRVSEQQMITTVAERENLDPDSLAHSYYRWKDSRS